MHFISPPALGLARDAEDTEGMSYFWRIGERPILQKLLRLSAGKISLCDLFGSVVNLDGRLKIELSRGQ